MKGINRLNMAGIALTVGGLMALTASGAQAQQAQSSARGGAVFSADPSSLSFGSINVGAISPAQPVIVKNTGGSTGFVVASSNDPQFKVTGCTLPVASGKTCTLSVSFSPRSAGTFSGLLSILRGPSIRLTGTGVGVAKLTVAQKNIELRCSPPKGGSTTESLLVANTGTATLVGVTATGLVAPFSANASNCASVRPGETCRVTVTYKAVSKDPAKGTLTIGSTNGGPPATVPVSGTCPRFVSA